MKALILSGGGARGAYEAGVVSSLVRHERFDIVCGTSIGAINGVFVAQGSPEALRTLWGSMAERRITRLRPEFLALRDLIRDLRAFARDSLLGKAGDLARTIGDLTRIKSPGRLTRLLGLFDETIVMEECARYLDFAKIAIPFIITATNLTLRRSDVFFAFPGPDGPARAAAFRRNEPHAWPLTAQNYPLAVRASGAIPPCFAPVAIEVDDGSTYMFSDGAVANNSPIRQAIDAGADEITVILVHWPNDGSREPKLRDLAHVAAIAFEIAQEHLLEYDLKLTRRFNAAVLRGAPLPGKRYVEMRVIGPARPLQLESLGFDDQGWIDRAFALGLEDGERACGAAGAWTVPTAPADGAARMEAHSRGGSAGHVDEPFDSPR
ncbi:MAG: patatin-like phospholipase family protein [Vulcanimicrobiaceae bacterium]